MSKVKIKNLTEGEIVKINNNFWKVLDFKHSHLGRGGANVQIKVKNIFDGTTLTVNFAPEDELELIDLDERNIKFIYKKEPFYYFMDEKNKKYQLSREILGFKANFIKKNLEIKGLFINNELVNIELPIKAKYLVIEAPPGLKGDSQKRSTKIVTIETGYQLNAPLFINNGDYIIVNTENGEYVERAK